MTNTTVADYAYATKEAINFILTENINTFPVDINAIITRNKWFITDYSTAANELGISYHDLKSQLDDSWGTVAYDGINYSILFDDKLCNGAKLFTIMHEIGHIKLKHLRTKGSIYIKGNQIINSNNTYYKKIENEANCFARNALSPILLLDALNFKYDSTILVDLFGLTPKAAKTRLDLYRKDLHNADNFLRDELICSCKDFLYSTSIKLDCVLSDTSTQIITNQNNSFDMFEIVKNFCYVG
ncbi:MAG: ImmA/IrrE family metallo-endopeptidase [Cellulosilyticaceae bacterium]